MRLGFSVSFREHNPIIGDTAVDCFLTRGFWRWEAHRIGQCAQDLKTLSHGLPERKAARAHPLQFSMALQGIKRTRGFLWLCLGEPVVSQGQEPGAAGKPQSWRAGHPCQKWGVLH